MNDLFKSFLDYCQFQKNLSSKTLKAYGIDFKQFLSFISGKNIDIKTPECVNKDLIIDFLKHLLEKYKIKSVKRKIACLKAFFNFLESEDIILVNPFRKVKIHLKEPKVLPKALNLNEIEGIIRNAYKQVPPITDSYTYKSTIRDIAVIELLFATGFRVSELCNIKTNEIDFDNSFVKVNGKGSKERVIFIENKDVIIALKNYATLFQDKIQNSDYFFLNRFNSKLSEQSVRYMIKKHAQAVKIGRNITPHMFRHSFATLLLEEGVDIKYIQHFLGHSSIMTTQIYTQVNKEKQKEILATKHPRNNFTATP
jgi:integrase/recombinase XerD